jgi:hypothetical protein
MDFSAERMKKISYVAFIEKIWITLFDMVREGCPLSGDSDKCLLEKD